jgi:hypothetical protein
MIGSLIAFSRRSGPTTIDRATPDLRACCTDRRPRWRGITPSVESTPLTPGSRRRKSDDVAGSRVRLYWSEPPAPWAGLFPAMEEDHSMRYLVIALIGLVAAGPPLLADDPPAKAADKPKQAAKDEKTPQTPAEQYKAVVDDYGKARAEFMKEYVKATTTEERAKVIKEKYPQPDKYAQRMMDIAAKAPKDPASADALVWVVANASSSKHRAPALEQLLKEHVDSPKLGELAQSLVYSGMPGTEKTLRTILDKSPHARVQAHAGLALAQVLKRRADDGKLSQAERDKISKEAEGLLEGVVAKSTKSKEVGANLVERAKRELFELRNLAIGKKAPQIEGEDIDGKKFALSDYKGKVVVLDFWGNW